VGARCQGETAFGHHLDEVTVRKLVPQIPTLAQHDDLAIEMAALEELVEARTLIAHLRLFARIGYRSPLVNNRTIQSSKMHSASVQQCSEFSQRHVAPESEIIAERNSYRFVRFV
jgi:hypothetical protein